MFGLLKNRVCAIGVDISQQGIRLAQLADSNPTCTLVAAAWIERPERIGPSTEEWARWVEATLWQAIASGSFKGKAAIGTLRPEQLVVETMRIPKTNNDGRLEEAIIARMRSAHNQRWTKDGAMVRYLQIDQDNAIVMVADRKSVEGYLAIMERAGLESMAIIPWPQAIASCYARFFGRRKSDLDTVVLLIYLEDGQTDLVISRHKMPLFARSIPIGIKDMANPIAIEHLVSEVMNCRRDLSNLMPNDHPCRVIFFSGQSANKEAYLAVARQLHLQAQIADCMAAVEIPPATGQRLASCGLDRRQGLDGWVLAFGLSLSSLT